MKTIAYVKITMIQGEEVTITDNYYIIDYQIPIERLVYVIRDHWNIECGLHWRLDVIMDEDHSKNRVGNSINNLSLLRKIVFTLRMCPKICVNDTFHDRSKILFASFCYLNNNISFKIVKELNSSLKHYG